MTDEERAFMRDAERSLVRTICDWATIDSALPPQRRLSLELVLLLKSVILIARDGLGLADEVMLTDVLTEVWDDMDAGRHPG
jgi:hypothetical protein